MTFPDSPITSVLSVGAHPDDLDMWAWAAEAGYAAQGAKIHRLILTAGGLGSNDPAANPQHVGTKRKGEEQAATKGHVTSVSFADFADCELSDGAAEREVIVRHIRQLKPQVVITWHPEDWHHGELGLNHPDHRACGAATLAAVFPLARNRHSFPQHIDQAGLQPHSVSTVLLMSPTRVDYTVDATPHLSAKEQALGAHASQAGLKDFFALHQKVLGPVETFTRINQPF